MENTEKQENVIQEVKTEETPVTPSNEEQKQEEPKVKAKMLDNEEGTFKIKFKSKAQMKYLFATNPTLAKKFLKKTSKKKLKSLPKKLKKKKR